MKKIILTLMLCLFAQLNYTIEFTQEQQLSITRLFNISTAFLAQQIDTADTVIHLAEISPHLLHTPFHRAAENMISALVNIFEGHLTIEQAEQAIHQEIVSVYHIPYHL